MDKYTYNIKADKIQKLVKKGDFEAAVRIADTIDWEEVHSVRLLTITAAAYENTRDYKSAIELLQMAYEESAVGKRILYKLTGLAIAMGDVELAQHYYEMYLQEASDDNGRYLLRYLLAELKKEPLDKRIAILETYRKYEFEEEWALRLAQMYDEAGMGNECVKLCDEIILWFGVGDYVDEAMALKEKYAPLSEEQKEHRDNKEFYEQRYQEVVSEYNSREEALLKRDEEENDPEAAAQKEEESWSRQILLVEADSLEEAVPKALERVSIYYRAKGLPMGKISRISAERFNEIGFEAAREHLKDRDLLVDEASALSEDLLSDIVHSLKYEKNSQLFILTDKPTQLAYLDARLGEFTEKDVTVPQIAVSEPHAEDVLMHVSETVEDELSEQKKTEEEAVKEEQLELKFDMPQTPEPQDWASAAEAARMTAELPKVEAATPETELMVPENEEKLPETELNVPEIEEKLPEPELNVPETEEKLPEIELNVPETEEKLPEPELNVTEIEEKLPEPELNVPEIEENLPEPELNVPEIEEKLPEIELNVPEIEEKLPEIESKVPEIEEKLPEPELNVPEIEEKLPETELNIPEIEEKLPDAEAAVTAVPAREEPEIRVPDKDQTIISAVQAAVAGIAAKEMRGQTAEEKTVPSEQEEPLTLNDLEDGVQWTFDDFLRDQKAAREATEKVSAPEEEAPAESEPETWAPFIGDFEEKELSEPVGEIVKKTEETVRKAEEAVQKTEFPVPEKTKVVPTSKIREAVREREALKEIELAQETLEEEVKETLASKVKAAEENAAQDLAKAAPATTVVSALKAAVAEAGKPVKDSKPIEGETKAVKKVSTTTEKIGAIGMSEEAFVEYAKNYLTSIDCVLDDVGDLALQNAAESRVANGTLLTKEEAENMIEEAADLAEKKGGLFVRRYDKEGCLILRSKYIK